MSLNSRLNVLNTPYFNGTPQLRGIQSEKVIHFFLQKISVLIILINFDCKSKIIQFFYFKVFTLLGCFSFIHTLSQVDNSLDKRMRDYLSCSCYGLSNCLKHQPFLLIIFSCAR